MKALEFGMKIAVVAALVFTFSLVGVVEALIR